MFGEEIDVLCKCGNIIETNTMSAKIDQSCIPSERSSYYIKCSKCQNEIEFWYETKDISKKRWRKEIVTVLKSENGIVEYSKNRMC